MLWNSFLPSRFVEQFEKFQSCFGITSFTIIFGAQINLRNLVAVEFGETTVHNFDTVPCQNTNNKSLLNDQINMMM